MAKLGVPGDEPVVSLSPLVSWLPREGRRGLCGVAAGQKSCDRLARAAPLSVVDDRYGRDTLVPLPQRLRFSEPTTILPPPAHSLALSLHTVWWSGSGKRPGRWSARGPGLRSLWSAARRARRSIRVRGRSTRTAQWCAR